MLFEQLIKGRLFGPSRSIRSRYRGGRPSQSQLHNGEWVANGVPFALAGAWDFENPETKGLETGVHKALPERLAVKRQLEVDGGRMALTRFRAQIVARFEIRSIDGSVNKSLRQNVNRLRLKVVSAQLCSLAGKVGRFWRARQRVMVWCRITAGGVSRNPSSRLKAGRSPAGFSRRSP